jgi:hypothetical protein
VGAEVLQHADVFLVAAAALDQPDGAAPAEGLDVVDRGFVEIDQLDQLEDASSMSSTDMWQPKQPAREVVATLGLAMTDSFVKSEVQARRNPRDAGVPRLLTHDF